MSLPRAAWGFNFLFETDDPLLGEVVDHCYGDLPPTDAFYSVMRAVTIDNVPSYRVTIESPDGSVEPCGDGRSRRGVLELLAWEVNRRARQSVTGANVLHAAVTGGPRGAIVLCGAGGSGKSTLAAAAARRGWWHGSDDLALVDIERGTVTPYARPLMLRPGGRAHLGRTLPIPPEHLPFFGDDWFVPASALGAVVTHEPRPLLALGMLQWTERAATWPINRARTLHDLVLHSATIAQRGVEGFLDLERLAAVIPGLGIGLGAADEVLDLLAPAVGMPVLA